jgi:hypothetical protein
VSYRSAQSNPASEGSFKSVRSAMQSESGSGTRPRLAVAAPILL